MAHNVGRAEQLIRIILGMVLLGAGFLHFVTGTLAIVAYAVGAVALLTGLIRFCPAWALFGINTCALKQGPQK
jgi:uncharacterized membrane protein HdeD (DUF308 family)